MKTNVLLLLLILVPVLFAAWFLYSVHKTPIGPPNPPLDTDGKHPCLVDRDEFNDFFLSCNQTTLYIAESPVDLTPFLKKTVTVKAAYPWNADKTGTVQSTQQCIQEECHPFFGGKDSKIYAVEIQTIHVVK